MEILTQPLEKPVPAVSSGGRGVAVVISLFLHGLIAAALVLAPLKIVEWSSTPHQGPFEVTLADTAAEEPIEADPQPVEADEPPEIKPVPPARLAPPSAPARLITVAMGPPTVAPGQLAFVTVPEHFEASLDFEPEANEEPEPAPDPTPPKSSPKSSTSPSPAKPATKRSSTSSKVVSARVIRNPSPVYPATARDKGQQGTVIFTVAISSKGSVNRLRLSKSSGYSLLDAAAEKAVKRWKFAPANRGGIAVASQVRVPIQFQIR